MFIGYIADVLSQWKSKYAASVGQPGAQTFGRQYRHVPNITHLRCINAGGRACINITQVRGTTERICDFQRTGRT